MKMIRDNYWKIPIEEAEEEKEEPVALVLTEPTPPAFRSIQLA